MSPPLLRAMGVSKCFDTTDRAVLSEVSFAVEPGEWLAITGRSGCGKSTLLHLLGGLDTPTEGVIEIAGTPISDLGESARARFRRSHVGYVFQRYNLVDDLTAAGNVELALALGRGGRRDRRAAAGAALDRLGLGARAKAFPAQLSGGEQQRVALARALATRPTLVLADEPTGALDSEAAAVVVELFGAARRQGQTIVMATHDPSVASNADRVLHLSDGRLGTPVAGFAAARAT
jgi:putative ABC transport system ATP-binding protein